MATNTSRLGLLKKDTVTDGNDTFNIKTMLNDNWDKIDAKVATLGADGKVPADQLSISVSDASTTQKGVVMLEDSVASTSITKAATPKSVKTVNDALDAHKTDYVLHPGVATTTNTANAYAVTLNPAPTSYTNGMGLVLTINADSTGASTINVNSLGAKAIKKANGSDVTNLKANGVYTLRYNATTGNFILQGEGGEYGTATANEVLQGYTLGTENGIINGAFTSFKSKQYGSTTLSPTDTFIDVSISTVNISKSILDISCSPSNSNETSHAAMAVKIEFINTNTIRLTRAKASGSTTVINVYWVVYEFNNVKSLQRGSKTLAGTTYNDVSISTVNTTKSMLFISYTDSLNSTIQSSYISRYFSSSSLITFHCLQPTDKVVNWQVIEFY